MTTQQPQQAQQQMCVKPRRERTKKEILAEVSLTIDDIKPMNNYSIVETCKVLAISRKTLFELRADGTIRHYLRNKRTVRFKGREIIKFYNS